MAIPSEHRDPLTGVCNRKYVFGIADGILGHNGQIALILIDVDRMKPYQDAFGFGEGDKRLKEIAREIELLSGENPLVFRYGGDEFGVILYESSLETARKIAETIRAHRQPIMVKWREGIVETLTLSLGIAHFPTQVSSWENLLDAAYLALLKAKGEGKHGGRRLDGTPYIARNRVMAIGDFFDDFPEQSARFLKNDNQSTGN